MLLDVLGAFASLLSTYYFIRLNNKAWLFSLIATLINSYLYWQKGIYADTLLEIFYLLTIVYGWLAWHKVQPMQTKEISYLTFKQSLILITGTTGLFIGLNYFLSHYTSSSVASLDALTTALSLIAQYLMCHKIRATWIVWFFTDAIYAYLYHIKKLPVHSLLMCFYIGLAIIGYRSWSLHPKKSTKLRFTVS